MRLPFVSSATVLLLLPTTYGGNIRGRQHRQLDASIPEQQRYLKHNQKKGHGKDDEVLPFENLPMDESKESIGAMYGLEPEEGDDVEEYYSDEGDDVEEYSDEEGLTNTTDVEEYSDEEGLTNTTDVEEYNDNENIEDVEEEEEEDEIEGGEDELDDEEEFDLVKSELANNDEELEMVKSKLDNNDEELEMEELVLEKEQEMEELEMEKEQELEDEEEFDQVKLELDMENEELEMENEAEFDNYDVNADEDIDMFHSHSESEDMKELEFEDPYTGYERPPLIIPEGETEESMIAKGFPQGQFPHHGHGDDILTPEEMGFSNLEPDEGFLPPEEPEGEEPPDGEDGLSQNVILEDPSSNSTIKTTEPVSSLNETTGGSSDESLSESSEESSSDSSEESSEEEADEEEEQHLLLGKWKLISASSRKKTVIILPPNPILLQIKPDEQAFRLDLHAANKFATDLVVTGEKNNGSLKVRVAPLMSTKKETPEEYKDVETVLDAMEYLNEVKVVKDLYMNGKKGIQLVWERVNENDED